MSGTVNAHRPVAQASQPATPRRAKPASLFARLFLDPPLSGWELVLLWLAVLIASVIAMLVIGQYEVLR